MPKKSESAAPEVVHVMAYYDAENCYVGLDVFGNFEAALQQFDRRLAEERAAHPGNSIWITELIRDVERQELYFSTANDYEVFYRREIVQNECKSSNEK